jgi:hypothetical protein
MAMYVWSVKRAQLLANASNHAPMIFNAQAEKFAAKSVKAAPILFAWIRSYPDRAVLAKPAQVHLQTQIAWKVCIAMRVCVCTNAINKMAMQIAIQQKVKLVSSFRSILAPASV